MNTTVNYTNESNARRAAKRMIAGGNAPASDFEIKPDAAGLFTIHWLTNGTAEVETEIATAADAADQPAPGEADPAPAAATPIPAPPETKTEPVGLFLSFHRTAN
jgi:hypothetical protein